MNKFLVCFFLIFNISFLLAQKDSLKLGDRYAEDQLYTSIAFAQFINQPKTISKSEFSFGFSIGFIKDFILNKQGSVSIAIGVGYGYDFFNHNLKVQELNNETLFDQSINVNSSIFKSHNLEFPLEFRWRTSNAQKFDFWRIYAGMKFLYNLSNKFSFEENGEYFSYKNVTAYTNFQYGLTFSVGYDVINLHVFYNLTPIFNNAILNAEPIDTRILKFGFIFYLL